MQWHKYREKHGNKLLFKCIFMNVHIRVHTRKRKQNILQYEIQKKSDNYNNLGKITRLYSSFVCAIYTRTISCIDQRERLCLHSLQGGIF